MPVRIRSLVEGQHVASLIGAPAMLVHNIGADMIERGKPQLQQPIADDVILRGLYGKPQPVGAFE